MACGSCGNKSKSRRQQTARTARTAVTAAAVTATSRSKYRVTEPDGTVVEHTNFLEAARHRKRVGGKLSTST